MEMPLYVKQQERNTNNNTTTNTMVNATAVGTAGKVVHSNSKQHQQKQSLQHQHHHYHHQQQQHRCRAAHVKQAFKHEPSYPFLLSPPSRYCENIFRRLMSLCFILLVVLVRNSACNFINQVAVHIEGGVQNADRVAKEHGFKNLGQIGSLTDKYLFEHSGIAKRSLSPSHTHLQKLSKDQNVIWFEQQIAKRRTKRDFAVEKVNDPFFPKQWYFHGGGHGGYDMNVMPAWQMGYTGKGIVISILDDGIEKDHPDLKKNYDPRASYDVNGKDPDPTPRYDATDENRHGTRCAGEVAAEAGNNICGIGVAYNARIGGVRMLDGFVTDAVEAASLNLNPQYIDIYSASWGPDDNGEVVDGPGPLTREAFASGIQKGRGGLGSIFVWASGNGGSYYDSCNCDGYTNSIYTLSISSTSKNGVKPWYLEECASTVASTYSSGSFNEPQIVTIDLRKKCTSTHTGTSASAPIAAGIVALALEANKNLTWRDIQYITILTARPEPMTDGQWTRNALGRNVSLRYGYGLMDAVAMVNYAKLWVKLPEKHICEVVSKEFRVPLINSVVRKSYLKVDGCQGTTNGVQYLEHVQAQISLTYSRRGDLKIMLTSPNGTRSVLLPPRPNDLVATTFDNWPFLTVHFWGEYAIGEWLLEIEDVSNHHSSSGTLTDWKLILHGTQENPVKHRMKSGFGNSITDSNDLEVFTTKSEDQIDKGSNLSTNQSPDSLCHKDCIDGCHGETAFDCKACKYFKLLSNGKCVSSCPKGFYGNPETQLCHHCIDQCQLCTGPLVTNCKSCEDGFYMDKANQKCSPCKKPCDTCQHNASNCTSCSKDYRLSGNTCVQTSVCAASEYRVDGECFPCFRMCASCYGPGEKQCLTCSSNFILTKGSCFPTPCSMGFYQDINGTSNSPICKRCHESCLTCRGSSSLDCNLCRSSYIKFKNECKLSTASIFCKTAECLQQHQNEAKTHTNFTFLLVFFSIILLMIFISFMILYFSLSHHKFCWANRYEKVGDQSSNKLVLSGDSGDEDEEKIEIK
ncbi:6-like protease kpc-1 isoform X2 [Octopus vulgaris]|uniref:6-like protease kpc-1 isoform X2 n=2 Tax=Octopus vulgaris TaxID=6645 RepID=A0AA36AN04_OCTVU|nr:6-like protease kpc-1 isoform X2 [Octopus vulgaris]